MHVDAFFEYLLENPHPYWTEIPEDPNPINEGGRDGVAAEDDMALRSLLPHIRPRRGRKRPDEENMSRSPTQKPGCDNPNTGAVELDLWSAQADGRGGGSFLFAPQDQFTRMNMSTGWTGDDFTNTPISASAYSAITPGATANAFWPEQQSAGEPKSAHPPTRLRTNRRHGAKVVSSAWRAGGPGGSGKTRGRPPLHRQNTNQGQSESSPFSAFQAHAQGSSPPTSLRNNSPQMTPPNLPVMMTLASSISAATITSSPHPDLSLHQGYDVQNQQQQQQQDRDLRTTRSRLSLQVPERVGGEVRLATSQGTQQPVVMVSGSLSEEQPSLIAQHSMAGPDIHMMDPFGGAAHNSYMSFQQQQQQHTLSEHDPHFEAILHPPHETAFTGPGSGIAQQQQHPHLQQQKHPPGQGEVSAFTDHADRTNLDGVESILTYSLLGAAWHDSTGATIAPCSVEEAAAIAHQLLDTMWRAAASHQAFLMNISTLTGTTFLRTPEGNMVRVYRVGQGDGGRSNVYDIHWSLQLGSTRGGFQLRETVSYDMWRGKGRTRGPVEGGVSGSGSGGTGTGSGGPERGPEEEEDQEDDASGDMNLEGGDSAERWRKKYQKLLGVVQEQSAELSEFRRGVLDLCRPRTMTMMGGRGGEDGNEDVISGR